MPASRHTATNNKKMPENEKKTLSSLLTKAPVQSHDATSATTPRKKKKGILVSELRAPRPPRRSCSTAC